MHTILILEDNADRIAAFESTVASFGEEFQLRLWMDAPTMIAECGEFIPNAGLISLDHDLNPQPGATEDPGTGVEVAEFIASHPPSCPVILHTSNHERRWSMHNALRFADWQIEIVGPYEDTTWIGGAWMKTAKGLIGL